MAGSVTSANQQLQEPLVGYSSEILKAKQEGEQENKCIQVHIFDGFAFTPLQQVNNLNNGKQKQHKINVIRLTEVQGINVLNGAILRKVNTNRFMKDGCIMNGNGYILPENDGRICGNSKLFPRLCND